MLVVGVIFKAFALTGRKVTNALYPGRCPGLGVSALSGRIAEINLRLFEINLRLFEINHYRPLSGYNIFSRFPRLPHNRPSRGWGRAGRTYKTGRAGANLQNWACGGELAKLDKHLNIYL